MNHSEAPKRSVGRPPKADNPEEQHEQELVRWIKVSTKIRQLIEKQLGYFEGRLSASGDMILQDQLDIMKGLGDLLKVASSTIESGLKALEEGKKSIGSGNDPDGDTIEFMESLAGGRG